MGAKTGIAWTDATWNPIRGCSMAKGSEAGGCLNCYAARLAARGMPGLNSSDGTPFARIMDSGPRWTGKVEIVEKALMRPLRWRKPRRIFVNSMSDLFHEALTDGHIDRVFAVMALAPQHTFQVLTKRPEGMLRYVQSGHLRWLMDYICVTCEEASITLPNRRIPWPLPNVWLGVSVENQATADARIPLLLQTPAATRFVSYEPALGPVDFRPWLISGPVQSGKGLSGRTAGTEPLDLIIVGGESGPGARPFDIAWARDVIEQCKSADVACFIKQLGPQPWLKDRKGADPSEWPEDLRVQEFPK